MASCRIRLPVLALASAVVAVAALPLPPATASPRFDYSAKLFRLSADRPAQPFGASFVYLVRDVSCPTRCPWDPEGEKPKNAVKIEVRLPRGTRYNPEGARICSFSRAVETGACPQARCSAEEGSAMTSAPKATPCRM